MNWRDNAACADKNPDLFFDNSRGYQAKAKRICGTCPVRVECFTLIMGLEGVDTETGKPYDSWQVDLNNRFGIFAGLTAFERWSMSNPGVDRGEAVIVRNRKKRQVVS